MSKDRNHIDNLFDKARNQQPETSFEETSGQFLDDLKAGKTSSLSQGMAKSFNFKYLIMLSSISAIIISTVVYFNSSETVEAEPSKTLTENEIIINEEEILLEIEEEVIVVETIEIIEDQLQVVTSTYLNDTTDSIVVNKEKVTFQEVVYPVVESKNTVKVKKQDYIFRFPKLTWGEQEQNRKRKKEMLKVLSKHKKNDYAFIPSGIYRSSMKGTNQTKKSVQPFYMQTTEVTNLQYRTFLFDLLIQNRKEDFLKAKPDQSKWLTYHRFPKVDSIIFNQPMADLYFSHPAYNQYPVVNITREGAEMYCQWLMDELKKSGFKTDNLSRVRIPTDVEWKYAASGGRDLNVFAWNSPYIKSQKGVYLANYAPKVKNEPIYWNKNIDTTKFNGKQKNIEGYITADSTDDKRMSEINKALGMDSVIIYIKDGGFHMVKVDSYTRNEYGLYCMSGNVSEMVYYGEEDNLPGTKGGSFLSPLNEILIEGKDFFKGYNEPEAEIGFRVVFSHMTESDKSTGANKIKITKSTTKEELEEFKTKAEKEGIVMNYKARIFNNRVQALTLLMDPDNDPNNCGAIYFKGNLKSNDYVEVGWNSEGNGMNSLSLSTGD